MKQISRFWPDLIALLSLGVAALAVTRLLYEGAFPRGLWLARPLSSSLLALLLTGTAYALWRRRTSPAVFLPLWLNLLFLFDPAVDLVESRLIFAAAVWGTAVLRLGNHLTAENAKGVEGAEKRGRWVELLLLLLAVIPIYALTMPLAVGRADTFEFQVVVPQLGIAHPTGYPLYLLLSHLLTRLVPLDGAAARLNLVTAVYALLALLVVAGLLRHRLGRSLPALLAAVALGLTPVFWSQAVAAEVYALHALLTALSLALMLALAESASSPRWLPPALAAVLGLGLTNHLTTVFLLPPAGIALWWGGVIGWDKSRRENGRVLAALSLAFLLPLTLYAYLPLRWAALNGEPMGVARFLEWVIGGRFAGALQWDAWLRDPTRYRVLGRLFLDNWGGVNLILAGLGLFWLLWRRRRIAVLLGVAWIGFTFYALNYYVPDLAVFLTPAHVVIALCWGAGLAAILAGLRRRLKKGRRRRWATAVLLTALVAGLALRAAVTWERVSGDGDGEEREQWARSVLSLPLKQDAAILADSDKHPPLYYVQQTEEMRPDLDIVVLPDEAAYRAELETRLAAGQPVYLARFLPGLEGVYHLRAAGPLTEVGQTPLAALPDTAVSLDQRIGPLALRGYQIHEKSFAPRSTAVTLYWEATQPLSRTLHVYTRWAGERLSNPAGQHPANDDYPTPAWQAGELVPDFHLAPHPILTKRQQRVFQVALAPPFTPVAELDWRAVVVLTLPATPHLELERPLRIQVGGVALSGAGFAAQVRPEAALPVTVAGYGATPGRLRFGWGEGDGIGGRPEMTAGLTASAPPFTYRELVEVGEANGRYSLTVSHPGGGAICGWWRPPRPACVLGMVTVAGVPLPPGATNFADKIALLEIDLPQRTLTPAGQLPVTLRWQGLAPMERDYTLFLQVLDEADRIAGQVDAFPLQGTLPTSQWRPGQTLTDSYQIQLDDDLPPGEYRLLVGWYLLADLRRLPVLDENGAPIDDKVTVPGLVAP